MRVLWNERSTSRGSCSLALPPTPPEPPDATGGRCKHRPMQTKQIGLTTVLAPHNMSGRTLAFALKLPSKDRRALTLQHADRCKRHQHGLQEARPTRVRDEERAVAKKALSQSFPSPGATLTRAHAFEARCCTLA